MATHTTKRHRAPGVDTEDATTPRFVYVGEDGVVSASLEDLAAALRQGYYSGDGNPWRKVYAAMGDSLVQVFVVMQRDHEGRLQRPDEDDYFHYTYEVLGLGQQASGYFFGEFTVTIDGRA